MVYGYKRKATRRMAYSVKKPRRVIPTRVVRPASAGAKIVKTSLSTNWTFTSTAIAGYWRYLQYAASDFTEFTEFATIFDEYRVTNLKYTFRPKYNSFPVTDGVSSSLNPYPMAWVHTIVDQSSAKIPSGAYLVGTENAMLENGSVRTFSGDKAFSFSFKPKVNSQLQSGGTASKSDWAPWIRTTEPAVLHNGAHVFIKQHGFDTDAYTSFDIYVTASIEFRGAR